MRSRAAYRPAPAEPEAVASGGTVDRIVGQTRTIGVRQVGSAAWYGGSHVGMRTASGVPLDGVHPTAAHRSLPLNSLLRVTNLKNGRSVVVLITDRGPASPHLLVDLSPRAADELDMKRDGIVPVAIEPVILQTASYR